MELLSEAYYGKGEDLARCEELIAKIKKDYSSGSSTDLTRKNCKELNEIAIILSKRFNFGTLDMRILRPKPVTYMFSETVPSTGLGFGSILLFSLVPNAYTFSAPRTNPFTSISVVESKSGIRFESPQDGIVHITGPLFFSPDTTPRQLAAIILHEVGHNFFLRTDARFVNAVNHFIETSFDVVFTLDAWKESLKVLANPSDVLAVFSTKKGVLGTTVSVPRVIGGLITTTIATLASVFPKLGTALHTASQSVFDVFETVLRKLIPADVEKYVKRNLGSVKMKFESMLPSYGIMLLGAYVSMASRAAMDVSFYVFSSIGRTFTTLRSAYKLAAFFVVAPTHVSDEIYADAFATRHGYGAEVAQFSEIFERLRFPLPSARSLGILADVLRALFIYQAILNPHPANVVRAKLAGDTLRKELEEGAIESKDHKKVMKAIEEVDKVHDRMVKDSVNQVEGPLYNFYVTLTDYVEGRKSAKQLAESIISALKGEKGRLSEATQLLDGELAPNHELIEEAAARHGIMESNIVLNEGLGSLLKNLATGDIEEEIENLKKEAKDIHTPEQQRYVLTKIVRLLERLVILRHNPSKTQKYVNDSIAFFQKKLGDHNAGKELSVRTGEAIRDLSKLRDDVLAKKWNDEKYNDEVDKLKDKVKGILDKASNEEAEDDDY